MTTTPTFSLRDLVAEIVESSGMADPGAVAAKVAAQIPEAFLSAALDETLRPYVSTYMSTVRRTHLAGPVEPKPRPEGVAGPSRASIIRGWYASLMASSLRVADGYKHFGDCTAEDLAWAIAERERQAAANAAMAEQLAVLRDELVKAGCTRVRDLPTETVARVTGRAS